MSTKFESIKHDAGQIDKTSADERDLLEDTEAENSALRQKAELHQQQLKDMVADRDLRKEYANKIMKFLSWYSIGTGVLLLGHGLKALPFELETPVLVTLSGGTAVAAIGLVGFVAKGLFPQNK